MGTASTLPCHSNQRCRSKYKVGSGLDVVAEAVGTTPSQPAKRRRNDVETTSEHVVESTSKVVENANGIDVEISTLFRRIIIDVASMSEYRRRFHVTFSTSYQRRIIVENANGRR